MTDTSTRLGESLRLTDGYDPIGMTQQEIRLAMLAVVMSPYHSLVRPPYLKDGSRSLSPRRRCTVGPTPARTPVCGR